MTVLFCVIMAVLFIVALYGIVQSDENSKLNYFAKSTPTILTSVGILGTFAGIVIALIGFDDNNIKAHINQIIAGMQTAFITSVVGVFLSILLKLIILRFGQNHDSTAIIAYTIELLESQNENLNQQTQFIKQQNDNINQQSIAINHQTNAILKLLENNNSQKHLFEKQAIAIEKLANAIGSDSENSLVGQITRMRSDMNDNHKFFIEKLHELQKLQSENLQKIAKSVLAYQDKRLHEFQEKLFLQLDKVSKIISKSATEQVINALKEVISDFNNNLTEQFGENFKELNQAVFKLVEWQDNYAHQIEQMIKQYEQGVLAIENAKTSVIAIENSTKSIPNTMNDLSEIIKVNQHQIDELGRHLHAFGELQAKATQALPKTQEHIDMMIKGIDDGATVIINGMNATYQIMNESLTNHNNQIQKDLKDNNDRFILSMDNHYKSLSEKLTEYNTNIQKDLKDNNTQIVQGMNDVYTSMSKQLTEYNNNIQHDLKDSNKQIIDTMTSFNNLFQQSSNHLNQDLNNVNDMIKSQISHSQTFVSNLKSDLDKIAKDFENYVKETNQTQLSQMQKVLQGVDNSAQTALNSTAESIQKQIGALNTAQQKELEEIIKAMGQALVTITNQFTSDYTKLVREMDKIIRTHNNKF